MPYFSVPKLILAGSPPQTPLGELTAPSPLAGIKPKRGPTSKRKGGVQVGKGKGREGKGRGGKNRRR